MLLCVTWYIYKDGDHLDINHLALELSFVFQASHRVSLVFDCRIDDVQHTHNSIGFECEPTMASQQTRYEKRQQKKNVTIERGEWFEKRKPPILISADDWAKNEIKTVSNIKKEKKK